MEGKTLHTCMELKKIAELYLSELLDRGIRLHQHIITVEQEFYNSTSSGHSDPFHQKPDFLTGFEKCVEKVIEGAVTLLKSLQQDLDEDQIAMLISIASHGFTNLKELHEKGLESVPRPAVPIELRRFTRIIAEHVFKEPDLRIALYVKESVSESAYASDPLGEFREKSLKSFVEYFDSIPYLESIEHLTNNADSTIDITIPRIDSRNPATWPTLFHEAAHSLLTNEILNNQTFSHQFAADLNANLIKEIERLNINLESWTTEVWCDYFAAYVIGPSFFFSQYYAFLAIPNRDPELNKSHPPSFLRLKLISSFLEHRYPLVKEAKIANLIQKRIRVLEIVEKRNSGSVEIDRALRIFSGEMRMISREMFFSGSDPKAKQFRERFKEMTDYTGQIEMQSLDLIFNELKLGLPTPSIRIDDDYTHERPTSVQEVLLAACLVRDQSLIHDTIETVVSNNDPTSIFLSKSLARYERLDAAILRSLQLSEWLFMFKQKPSEDFLSGLPTPETVRTVCSSALTDREIYTLLKSGEIRITPLIDVKEQLGSCSLDIRLGTSFEVFIPATRRPSGFHCIYGDSYESKRIDLDFLENISLLPGEFMLAHSFEYLKLPDWIAGDLDGRSTYARLGLEIHMTAGMIDPGFEGTTTLELFNAGPNAIRLFPGVRIGQMRFRTVTPPQFPYSKKRNAKYGDQLQHHQSMYQSDREYEVIYKEMRKRETKGG